MDTIHAAAEKILSVDILVVALGAGFSADSGLPVYKDVATVDAYIDLGLDYQDLCDPYWVHEDWSLFLGFWGDSFNMYNDAAPHEGYEILKQWKERLAVDPVLQSLVDSKVVTSDPFFVFTSNVDAHCRREFAPNELYEIHGNIMTWQCAGKNETSPPCSSQTWTVPSTFRFDVDKSTMRAEYEKPPKHLKCPRCKAPGRPNVLMFRDKRWVSNEVDRNRYRAWKTAALQVLQHDPSKRMVVLEIGCGIRVKTVRKAMEELVDEVFAFGNKQATLIRINPDIDDANEPNDSRIHIQGTGLATLQLLDQALRRSQRAEQIDRPSKKPKRNETN
ncbi:hypothetical protein AeMF1_000327 [Aphanomyces euteiches]|nr:hypothetical protein AeMF1_000327 [Aphanomyces euteiches]KAH9194767.1 hypothetical protein AeNC1_003253 [Aphanomyces euteiches]